MLRFIRFILQDESNRLAPYGSELVGCQGDSRRRFRRGVGRARARTPHVPIHNGDTRLSVLPGSALIIHNGVIGPAQHLRLGESAPGRALAVEW